jgi:spermidine/putrescine transport system permease protein
MALPAAIWFFTFLMVPLLALVVLSFLKRGSYGSVELAFSLDNFRRSFDPLYARVLWQSLVMAASVTFWTLLLGAPTAFTIARAPEPFRRLLFLIVMLPFLTNFILRAWAIRSLLGARGPLHALLHSPALDQGLFGMDGTGIAVAFGMVTNYLPFMVIPLFVVFDRFDFRLLEAASDLGASRVQTLWRVLIPLVLPGLGAGCLLVFIPAMGEFLIPDFLGGARSMMVGNLVMEQFLKARDWPFGAAIAVQVLAIAGALASLRLFVRWHRMNALGAAQGGVSA